MPIRPLQALLIAGSLFAFNAQAAYPDRPIRLIVPWAAGGSTDAVARAVAQHMSETMGQSVVVDNRSGGSGRIGTEAAARSAPDGHTIAIVELPHAIAPAVFIKMPYDLLRDFTPVSMLGTSPLLLFVNASQYRSGGIQEFLKDGRASATPLPLAHSGNGTVSHLAGELFAAATRVKINPIPYRGSAPALVDVAAGLVSSHFSTLASGAPLLGAGKISALMVTGPSRVAALPNVPTASEAGIPGMVFSQWWALVAPATTPTEIVQRLNREVAAALAHPATRERLTTLGIEVRASTPDELRTFMRSEVTQWADVVRKAGINPE
ncbi:tripartite tricarboxylate transporter substrate binding protein [Aquincola sp. S2]|uniref:Tripartite tricarboxylate transporter substrate binding protein n=1 Tax=Pseudaquabacterium terrae TaxID=2732868 RepID=A0ABX2EQZ2_9BURK|nr:tripartite tricarboxylate transporter substrate binding protein [Aquabacterium terrae]NRF71043.1 tripartite tricarboxylate transporter substrate binding protein [Aquabacterium terrae]